METNLFVENYEDSRERFRQSLGEIRARWPGARLASHRLPGDEDLTIDWIAAESLVSPDRLLVFTTGEHGVEGYVGGAMLRLFQREFLPRLEPQRTGLLLVHAINPWGMKHRRRVNAANVDLNRNFVVDERELDPAFNADYDRLASFLNPQRPLRSLLLSNLTFFVGVLVHTLQIGGQRLRRATLLGQYRFPQYLGYGGSSFQEETRVLMRLYQETMPRYGRVVHLDMHTGYGPRYQMTLVNSALEPRDSAELAQRFGYPRVARANASEFYEIHGDMIDRVYALWRAGFPDKPFYATSFEFGTLGDSLLDALRSLRTMILERQVYQHGARNAVLRAYVARDFRELFDPPDEEWRRKAIADARQAFEGILRAEGFLGA